MESRVGSGSVFRVWVPVQEPEGSVEEERPSRHGAKVVGIVPGEPAPRVLIADDRDEGRAWIADLLRQIGFEVREAVNGAEAVDAAASWEPDLVFMDLEMPVLDGYGAIREIRARGLRARGGVRPPTLVAFTANALEDARAAIFATGADAWIKKPCREAEMLETIARHLGLEYRYEPALVGAAPVTPVRASCRLPPDLAAPLRDAARVADLDALRTLLEALPVDYAGSRDVLTKLADEFAYERLEAALDGHDDP